MNFNNVAIASVKGNDHIIHFWYMSRDDAISIIKNSDLNEKSGLLWIFLSSPDFKKWKLIIKEIKDY